jgi:hypothetical protein
MRARGLKVEDVFKAVRNHVEEQTKGRQTPWELSSLKGDFCFGPCDTPRTASPDTQADTERIFWEAIETSRDPQEFRNYLARYPSGRHRSDAEARLHQLESNEAKSSLPAASNENQSGGGSATRETGGWQMIEDQRVIVPATVAWTATNLKVEARQQLTINVSGPQVSLGAYGYSGPDGTAQADGARPLRDCPTGAMIARIGSNLSCVRSQLTFIEPSGGDLFLGLNLSRVAGNNGSFVARVRIYRQSR